MKPTLKPVLLLSLSVILFTSCNKNVDNEPTTNSTNQIVTTDGVIKGIISNYTSGTYDAIVGYDSGFTLTDGLDPHASIDNLGSPLGSCNVGNNGSFTLNLSTTSLTSIGTVIPSGVTVSDKNARLGGVGFGSFFISIFMLSKSGSMVGGLYKSDAMAGGSTNVAFFSLFLYSDRDFTINGTTQGTWRGGNMIYNLTLKKGWNEIGLKITNTSYEYSNSIPANMKWFYGSLSSLS